MTEVKKKKKKRSKKLNPIVRLICVLAIIASVSLLYLVGKEVYTTMSLQRELAEVEKRLQEVQDENKKLADEKEKLLDPDYVENYARGNHMLSKQGEQIFYLPSDDKK